MDGLIICGSMVIADCTKLFQVHTILHLCWVPEFEARRWASATRSRSVPGRPFASPAKYGDANLVGSADPKAKPVMAYTQQAGCM